MPSTIDWIAVDWGTTHLRVYALDKDNNVLLESSSTKGMGTLEQHEFESALLELVDSWLPVNGIVKVLACGMVGAKQGWLEAPYLAVPCPPFLESALVPVVTKDSRLQVYILPGASQKPPADVMRGEETQVAGFLALHDVTQATLCLPGTHSKWVSVVNGNIVNFATHMTGEMFNLLCAHSILRFSVDSPGWCDTAFDDGVEASIQQPENWLNACFALRAKSLLDNLSPVDAKSFLSGLLIGAEVAGAKSYWSDKKVALVGDIELAKLYARALASVKVESQILDPKALTLAGLCRAYQSLKNTQE